MLTVNGPAPAELKAYESDDISISKKTTNPTTRSIDRAEEEMAFDRASDNVISLFVGLFSMFNIAASELLFLLIPKRKRAVRNAERS